MRSASSDRLSRQSGASGFVDRFKICILKCLGKSSALLCDLGVQIRRGFSERFGTGSASFRLPAPLRERLARRAGGAGLVEGPIVSGELSGSFSEGFRSQSDSVGMPSSLRRTAASAVFFACVALAASD